MAVEKLNGFYAVYVTGDADRGLLLLALHNGKIVGVDTEGNCIDGAVSQLPNENTFDAEVSLSFVDDGEIVQGQHVPKGYSYQVNFKLSDDFLSREYIELQTPVGPVNASFKFLRAI